LNCPNCGTSNLDTASICANCGRPLAAPPPPPIPPVYQAQATYMPPPPQAPGAFGAQAGPPIKNYLIQSILVTLCCCMPLGIVAIVFAAQVNSKLAAGDVAGAREASSRARMCCWIAVGLGVVGFVIGLLINGAALLNNFPEAFGR
jgi:hypothetical protein